jgi:hypothetical protein
MKGHTSSRDLGMQVWTLAEFWGEVWKEQNCSSIHSDQNLECQDNLDEQGKEKACKERGSQI